MCAAELFLLSLLNCLKDWSDRNSFWQLILQTVCSRSQLQLEVEWKAVLQKQQWLNIEVMVHIFLASLWKVTEVVGNSDVVLKFERVPESIKQTQMKTQTVCLSFWLGFSPLFLTWPPSPSFLFSRPSHCLHSLFPLLSLPRCLAGFYCSSDNQRLSLLCHSVWVLQIAYLMEAYTPGAPTPTPLYSCKTLRTHTANTHACIAERKAVRRCCVIVFVHTLCRREKFTGFDRGAKQRSRG